MSNNKEEKCKEFWKELQNSFKDAIENIMVNKNDALMTVIMGGQGENGCQSPSVKSVNWEEYAKKLKNIGQSSAQQSGASKVAMASSLGPAAGIGERPFGPLLLFR